jgi:hypothetical protein
MVAGADRAEAQAVARLPPAKSGHSIELQALLTIGGSKLTSRSGAWANLINRLVY